jgi:hypothetical protein
MLVHHPQTSQSSVRKIPRPAAGEPSDETERTVRRCVDAASRGAARKIPHLDFDCLRAILAAHVQVNLGRFRGEAPLEHWLNRVLRNKVIDLVKFERPVGRDEPPVLDAAEMDPVDPRRGPVREASLSELRARVEEEYGETREGRLLLLLLTGEASTVTQAARILGWNHPTALARLRRHPLVQELQQAY